MGDLSRVARLTARREFFAAIPLGITSAVLTVPFCGFVALKALHASEYLLATILACHMAGLVLTATMVGLFHHRPKAKAIRFLLFILSAVLATFALTPYVEQNYRLGAYVFLVQIFLAQLCLGLMLTIRSAIWRTNYPTAHRAKVVVLIGLLMSVTNFVAITAFTAAMDYWSISFGTVYLVSGISGIAAALLMGRIRVHRERQHLREINKNKSDRPFILAGLAVLRTDHRFRKYMSWQMLSGLSTLVIETILIVIITDVFESNWLEGGSALVAIPMLIAGVSSLFWAQLFDRTDIFTMRFYASVTWAASRVVLAIAVFTGSMPLVLLSRVVSGIAMGGGMIAWRLGHMAFAPQSEDSLYMGAHIGLTGLRGLVAPFIGIYLYHVTFLGPHGTWLILISAACQITAGLAFLRMRKTS